MKPLILLLLAGAAWSQVPTMPNAVVMPQPQSQFFDNYGRPVSGGKLCTYAAGTTTPLATYTDSTAATPNSNPVMLDGSGRAAIFIEGQAYKFVLMTAGTTSDCSTGTVLWTQDQVMDLSLFYIQHLLYVSNSSLLSFVLAGNPTGSVTRTVQAKESDWISALDFGVVGDGVTDNSTTLQAAITYVQSIKGTLWIPPGTYNFSQTLTITGNGYIVIQGAGSIGTKLVYTGTGTAFKAANGSNVIYRLFLRDFRLVAATTAQYGVYFANVEESGLFDVGVGDNGTGFTSAGFYGTAVAIVDLVQSIFSNNGVGILLDATSAGLNGRVNISQNNIFNNSVAGIKAEYGTIVNIDRNWIEVTPAAVLVDNNNPAGIALLSQLNVTNNQYDTTSGTGQLVRVTSAISGNGLYLYSGRIEGNQVNASPASPYLIQSNLAGNAGTPVVNFTVRNNTLCGASSAGVTADTTTANFTLQNNLVYTGACGITAAPEWAYTGSGVGSMVRLDQSAAGWQMTGPVSVTNPTAATPVHSLIGNTSSYQNYYVDGVGATLAGAIGFYTAGNTGMGMINELAGGSLYFIAGAGGTIYLSPANAAGTVAIGPSAPSSPATVNIQDGTAAGDTKVFLHEGAAQASPPLTVVGPTGTTLFQLQLGGALTQGGATYANTSSLANGTVIWCTDCTVNTTPPNTCAASGSGAWMFVSNGVRKCPF